MERRRRVVVVVACLALAGCTSSGTSGSPPPPGGTEPASATTSGTVPSGVLAGYPTDVDRISPLVITTIAPDPIAFTGTDERSHLAYEIQIFNASPRPATLVSVETLADGPDGEVVATLSAEEIAARSLVVGPPVSADGGPTNQVPGGRVALLVLDETFDSRADVPARLTHRVDATFAESPDDDRVTELYPTEATEIGGDVTVSSQSPLVIGPPLAGDDWVTYGSCCTLAGHRAFMMPIGGRMNGTERFGLEYIRFDLDRTPLIDTETGDVATYTGDPAQNESYRAWGQPILAVADATVSAVRSDVADGAPGAFKEGLELSALTGNYVVLDLGDGVHAMANHLQQGSPTVRVGDHVTRGQVIGRVGNSGNTRQPHLHFQLYRGTGAAPLTGDNVPFEIDRFTYVGQVDAEGVTTPTPAGERIDQYPLNASVTNYPAA